MKWNYFAIYVFAASFTANAFANSTTNNVRVAQNTDQFTISDQGGSLKIITPAGKNNGTVPNMQPPVQQPTLQQPAMQQPPPMQQPPALTSPQQPPAMPQTQPVPTPAPTPASTNTAPSTTQPAASPEQSAPHPLEPWKTLIPTEDNSGNGTSNAQ